MLKRKVTYRLYPNASQEKRLHEMLLIHQRVYNEALEARITAYRDENRTLSFADQCKTLTLYRKVSGGSSLFLSRCYFGNIKPKFGTH